MKVFNSWGYKHYNGVHWYPRISVYDAKFGWTIDQHLVKEFYGNFGAFDVELTFPSNYVVEGTGNTLNRNEVLPPSLRQKLDIPHKLSDVIKKEDFDIERLSKMALDDPSTSSNPKKMTVNDMKTLYEHSMSGKLF